MSVRSSLKRPINGLKVQSAIDSPIDTSIIISGCCTSTPRETPNRSKMPKLCFVEEDDEVANHIMIPTLHPEINFASQPIFGRLNLQSLNDCLNKDEKITRKDLIQLLRNAESTEQDLPSSVRGTTVCTSIKKQKNYQEDSESVADNFKREFKMNLKRQTSKLAIGLKKVQEDPHTFRRTINYTAKRQRANNTDSNIPIPKININRPPKSPKLLTAIRAKLREKRKESIKKSPQQRATILNKKSSLISRLIPTSSATETSSNKTSTNPICVSKKKERELDKKNNVKSLRLSVHFQSRREGTTNNYEQLRNKKICPIKNERMTSYTDQKKIDAQKMTAFKAPSIHKIPGLPIVKKRQITIPTSPKLGQRRNLSSK